jgi:hypothetical protein
LLVDIPGACLGIDTDSFIFKRADGITIGGIALLTEEGLAELKAREFFIVLPYYAG